MLARAHHAILAKLPPTVAQSVPNACLDFSLLILLWLVNLAPLVLLVLLAPHSARFVLVAHMPLWQTLLHAVIAWLERFH